ncbi:MAG: hypothetical protein H7Z15_11985 [Rhizobacter sp.]|nr:hypothetical protein [Rhizobacter sp.]
MPHCPTHHRLPTLQLLASGCLLAAATCATAQEEASPYYVGVSQAFTHESNLRRTATNEISETISSTGVLAGVNQRFGRQRLRADASAQTNRYRTDSTLDNKSYGLAAELNWETVEFLSGTVRYNTRNSLTNFARDTGDTIISDLTTDEAAATVRYGVTSYLALDAGFTHRKLKYDNPELSDRNFSQDTVNAGVNWIVGAKLTLGVALRSTKGDTPEYRVTPDASPANDELKRRDVDLLATWVPSGFSTFNVRVSSTKETRSLATTGELSETTGLISWAYQPTGRLNFTTSLSRDTGAETTFAASSAAGPRTEAVDNNRLSNTLSLETRYSLTGKSALNASLRHRSGTQSDSRKETLKTYLLGGTYNATRNITLACSVTRESRDVESNPAYRTTITGCSGELSLR